MKSFILSLVCLLCVPLYLQAQSLNYPTGISYQGKLLNNGQLYEGTESILFELISENNIIRWSETQQVTITRGLYSVILGSVVPFGDDLFTENNDLMLRIKIGDNPPMMVSALNIVPYAYMAKSVADGAITTESIEGEGSNKVLVTNEQGNVTWVNQSELQTTAASLGSAGGDVSGNYNNLQINSNVITTNEIQDGTIVTEDIADNSVTVEKLSDDVVETIKIKNNAVIASKISTGAVETDKIQDNAITTDKIVDGAITESKIQGGGNNKVMTTTGTGDVIWVDRSTFTSGSLGNAGGDLSGDYSALEINAGVITETEIADNAVTEDKIQNSSVTTSKIQSTGNDLVLTTDATGNVMWENRNSFTTGSLGSAGGDVNGNYSNLQINPNAITETELANSSVTTSKIQSTGNDLVLTTDATGNVMWENRNSFTAGSLGSAGGDLNGNYSNLQINP
ncbi:hypothetical protein, partial [Bernardetia sp.]|uniref:hypothetical protein n=1 Tax=Bernardetia sp. TaxID=1937974 RepID=UPI0025C523C7